MPTINQAEMDEAVLMTRTLSLLGYINSMFQDHGNKPLSTRARLLGERIRKELTKPNPYDTKDVDKGYYHQFFITEVLGEEALVADNLADVHMATYDGHFSGETNRSPITWTNRHLTDELLMSQGSDANFLNKNGDYDDE